MNESESQSKSVKTSQRHRFIAQRPRELLSTFAFDQLTGLAGHLSEHDFWAWIVTIFGADLPRDATIGLRNALLEGSLPQPPIELVGQGDLGGYEAAYNRDARVIEIADELLDQALDEDGSVDAEQARFRLLVALVEEFGHHVDVLLRYEYSPVKPGEALEDGSLFAGDAELDEGAAFAHAAILLDVDRSAETQFAVVRRGSSEDPLVANYAELNEAVQRYADEAAVRSDDQSEGREHFGAGEPKVPVESADGHCFTHLSIEKAAFASLPEHLKFTEGEVHRIYFGNWLRDYSQLLDPKLVHHEENNPIGLKIETLTDIVDLLARSDDGFGDHSDFRVTPDKLGVYLPLEHIDNPDGYEDATRIHPKFRGAVRPEELEVDAQGVKNFIQASRDYVRSELAAAKRAGKSPEGMLHFGNALHVIEDYFSHSNFVELALRKVGFTEVDPWVPVPASGRAVLTTGSFGGLDTAATIILKLGEILQETDPFAIERSRGQKILLILMKDKVPNLARQYEWVLDNIEEVKRDHQWFFRVIHESVGQIKRWLKFVLGLMLRSIAQQIDDAQTASDPGGTNPTHTQIAKDDRDHHFHELAAELGIAVVSEIGLAMAKAWAGESTGTVPLADREAESRPVKSGDTLGSIAAEFGITWQELATFNWGTDQPRMINRKLYEVVGCRKPHGPDDPVDELANYRFSDDDHRYGTGEIRVPKPVPDSVDVVDLGTGYLSHPEDRTWFEDRVREWAEAHPDAIARGRSRTWLHDHAEHIREVGEQWTGGTAMPQPVLDWLEWLGRSLGP
ncbi:MAG: LysM peptidoglycan-binding domain-containing protein [Planctomycetes bacterium]|nr:LysM peptidoglycan-binding domain-containing protein [Planctomycetota bacterium]